MQSQLRVANKATAFQQIVYILIESGVFYCLLFVSKETIHKMMITDLYLQVEAVISDLGQIRALENSTPELKFVNTVWNHMTSHILVSALLQS